MMVKRGILLVLILTLAACGSMPDAKPFADATGVLATSVKSSGEAMSESLREAVIAQPEKQRKELQETASEFEKLWAARVNAMKAASAYSSAVAELVAAGQSGGETAQKTGVALEALAGALGIVSPVIGVVTEIGKFVYAKIAIVRASKSLEEAVTQAQPAIDKIAEKLVADLGRDGMDEKEAANDKSGLRAALTRAYGSTKSGIKTEYDADSNWEKALEKRRKTVMDSAVAGKASLADLQGLSFADSMVQGRMKQMEERLNAAAKAYKTRQHLLDAMAAAINAWAKAHSDLASAIKEKRKVSVAELESTISDLRDLLKKVREL